MKIALAAGLVLAAAALAVVMSRPPLIVAGTNSIPANPGVASVSGGGNGCQVGGTMPQGTAAIRISVTARVGPSVALTVLSGSRPVAHGERGAGWGIAETVTVPVTPVPRTIPDVRICVVFGPSAEPVQINGALVHVASAGGHGGVVPRFRVEYLRHGSRSWWSLASSVARRMGLGHAPAGTWVVFVLIALMITLVVLVSRLILAETAIGRRPSQGAGRALPRIPRAAYICALVAVLNAICWSLITPPFQVPDEPGNVAYVQQIAQTGRLPTSSEANYSQEEEVALRDLHVLEVRWHPERQPIVTRAQQQHLQDDLARPLTRSGPGDAGVAASEPPLYYALQAVPYVLGSSGSLLDRLELMRLLSALLAGVTALFVYLFIREALPGTPWAWAVGGLGVAVTPLLGFMSGAVSPDAMLYAVSAATFYLLARAFRRGLTPRLALAIGTVTAIGLLTKLNFIGLAPGVGVGLIVLTRRAAQASGRAAYRSLALALALAVSPVCAYVVINLFSNHPGLGVVSSAIHLTGSRGSVLDEAGYIWQFYLPRLPGMANDFPGLFPTHQIWFDRSVGLYGWLDTPFPVWVDDVALVIAVLLAFLGVRGLVAARAALSRRRVELAVYAVMGVGLMGVVGADSYIGFPREVGSYGEPRYMLPLLALGGAALVLCARGAGRRWGPIAGTLVVVLLLGHDLFSQLQVIARYYG